MTALVPVMPCAECGRERPALLCQLPLPWFKVPARYWCSFPCYGEYWAKLAA